MFHAALCRLFHVPLALVSEFQGLKQRSVKQPVGRETLSTDVRPTGRRRLSATKVLLFFDITKYFHHNLVDCKT